MKRILLSILAIPVVLFTSTLTTAIEEHTANGMRNRIETYIDIRGDIVYGAVYSLPETREAFIESVGDRAWSSHSPEYVSRELSFNEKENLISAVSIALERMSIEDQETYFERLEMWLAANRVYRYASALACIESTMGAVYAVPRTQSLFDWVIENRGFDPETIGAGSVGSTLASGEISSIEYELFNMLSGLSRRNQMAYFRDVFDKLLTDPDLEGCLSPPNVDTPVNGEREIN